jgi:hypothetical protein
MTVIPYDIIPHEQSNCIDFAGRAGRETDAFLYLLGWEMGDIKVRSLDSVKIIGTMTEDFHHLRGCSSRRPDIYCPILATNRRASH